MDQAQIGLIGLAVMGANLARNFASREIKTVVYNRTAAKTQEFIDEFGNDFLDGKSELKDFVESIEKPRKILLMVKSGKPVDAVIEQLQPFLEEGDIIIDGGNSFYKDTQRRQMALGKTGINFIGMGISGGEEGALNGPSLMPGGDKSAYEQVSPILNKIAADDGIGGKCVEYLGAGASGHFVKTVHNGIEYAIMQAIAEVYDVLKQLGKFSNEELHKIFDEWNKTDNLNSFLVEITAQIFTKKDEETGKHLIDLIQDQGKQKGTGKWTSQAAFDYGMPVPSITAATEARMMSAHPMRHKLVFPEALNDSVAMPSPDEVKTMTFHALELTTILSYFQGFDLLATTSEEHKWNLNLSAIVRVWRGGCIIRSSLLDKFQAMFDPTPNPSKKYMMAQFEGDKQLEWRKFISLASSWGIPIPTTQAALAYYDALRVERLPQNLTQAQRDLFGAHTFERTDKEGTHHANWYSEAEQSEDS